MAIDLTINYFKFAPLSVGSLPPYMSLLCYANFDHLNILSSIFRLSDNRNLLVHASGHRCIKILASPPDTIKIRWPVWVVTVVCGR